jgi:DNA primase
VGVNHVVAIKGSALTLEHGQLLKRLVETVVLSLDNDEAGIEATRKAIETLKNLDLELRVLPLEGSKDPADIAKTNPRQWRQLAKTSVSAYEFLIQVALKKYNANSIKGKKQVLKELAKPLWSIQSQVEREFYLKKLSKLLDVNLDTVSFDIKQFASKHNSTLTTPKPTITKSRESFSRLEQLERWVVMLLTHIPTRHDSSELLNDLTELEVLADFSSWFAELLKVMFRQKKVDIGQASRQLPDDMQQIIFEALADEKLLKLVDKIDFEKEWQKVIANLKAELLRQKRLQITRELEKIDRKRTKTSTDLAKESQLLNQLAKMS